VTETQAGMFLGAYHFDGEPRTLIPAYDRLMEQFPVEASLLHVCVLVEAGITVLDACPSRSVFRAFSQSAEFLGAVASAGLPLPRVEPLGDVHAARLRARAAR
jgi:hypothetical protein